VKRFLLYFWKFVRCRLFYQTVLQDVRKVWRQWKFYLLFITYIICSICSPRHYAFSQPLYHVCADFVQHIGIDSSTTICNSLPKVTKISDFNSNHLCLQESPKCKVQGFKGRWSWCPLHWVSPPNPSMRKHVIGPIIKIPIGSRLFGHLYNASLVVPKSGNFDVVLPFRSMTYFYAIFIDEKYICISRFFPAPFTCWVFVMAWKKQHCLVFEFSLLRYNQYLVHIAWTVFQLTLNRSPC
jgi:hypothetical protein